MAFFEEFGKKISKMGQTTVQKTKDFADITKLNSSITDEEKKINQIYFQIGKQYVELHGEAAENEFLDLISKIREGKERILEYQAEIEKIRGVMRCEKCGAEISLNSGFCSNCGSKIEIKQEILPETEMETVEILAEEDVNSEENSEEEAEEKNL